ncbi:uncharacterized protein LOC135819906 [Sycon ciliatum]|uniref:uncharacterized protein LOC135819906 n=1 Tax=Sycon ciliatum TaxID=27933 RepID=UPI0020A9EFE3|eukprot:scpid40010/ scgid26258/ PI-PLC X domain-containing protein 1
MASAAFPRSSWMAEDVGACKMLSPFQFCFPGTHDSGACLRLTGGPVLGLSPFLNCLSGMPGIRECLARWTITQPGLTIYNQLMGGIRFLDLRIGTASHNIHGEEELTYILTHTFMVGYLEEALDSIVHFIDEHPTEMIVIAFVLSSGVEEDALQRFVESHLGSYACPESALFPRNGAGATASATLPGPTVVQNTSVHSLTSAGHNLLLLGNVDQPDRSASNPSNVWLDKSLLASGTFVSLCNVHAKTQLNRQQLKDYLAAIPEEKRRRHLYQLPHTVTPQTSSIVWDVLTCRSLPDHAREMDATLPGFVLDELTRHERDAVNIITVDDYSHSDVVQVARQLVRERWNTVSDH